MLPKQHRLPGYLVLPTLRSTQTHHSPLFTLKVVVSKGSKQPTRIGFIISTKISKLAVNRNRLKRQLKAAVYSQLKNLKPNLNLVFLAKHPLKAASYPQIKTSLLQLLKQSKLLNNEKISPNNH